MKCLHCHKQMTTHNGVWGKFYSCWGHGTLSIQGNKVVATGLQFKALHQQKEPNYLSTVTNSKDYGGDLMLAVKAQTVQLGVIPTDVEEWIVDREDGDSGWMASRDY